MSLRTAAKIKLFLTAADVVSKIEKIISVKFLLFLVNYAKKNFLTEVFNADGWHFRFQINFGIQNLAISVFSKLLAQTTYRKPKAYDL